VRIAESSFYVDRGPPKYGRITVHGTFMTELHVVARTSQGKFFNLTFSAAEMGEWYDFGATLRALTASCATPSETPSPYAFKRHVTNFCDEVGVDVRLHNPATVILNAPDWRVAMSAKRAQPAQDYIRGARRRLDLSIDLLTDEAHLPTMPHGIVGQSWDGDGLGTDGLIDVYPREDGSVFTTYAMAEGAIEGEAHDYEVESAYETHFSYSRFDTHGFAARNVSALNLKTCIPANVGQIGSDVAPSRLAAGRRCWVAGKCADTMNPFVGLQPLIPPDCGRGISAIVNHGAALRRANTTMQQECMQTMVGFQATLSALGVPYSIPTGFTLSATAADLCPETCRAHDVIAKCLGHRRRLKWTTQKKRRQKRRQRRQLKKQTSKNRRGEPQ